MANFNADIHCHPTMKPYGNSFLKNWKTDPSRINSKNTSDKNSIYFNDPPTPQDLEIEKLGITRFSQSNLHSLFKGNVRIIFSSLYPIEKGFLVNKIHPGKITDFILQYFTGLGPYRIDSVQEVKDYFPDLEAEYNFLTQLNNQTIKIDGQDIKYNLITNQTELQNSLNDNTCFNIAVINTIEGAHSFGCGMDPINNPATNFPQKIIDNIIKVKNWQHPPLFITFAHHFYNELCGHEKSLDKISFAVDQSMGLGKDFTPLGLNALHTLLDKSLGKRILIDIKHLSKHTSRKQFFDIIETDERYKNEKIPIIVSHAAVIGSGSLLDDFNFSKADINFSDDEIIKIGKSEGLFGVMFDQGRIASKSKMMTTMKFAGARKWSELIWLQIAHIAKVLDNAGLPAWNIQTLGTDFDGIINSINGFYTAENLPNFRNHLLEHAQKFIKKYSLKMSYNKIEPHEIVSKIMSSNAYDFLLKNF
jgi:hypothetical protein